MREAGGASLLIADRAQVSVEQLLPRLPVHAYAFRSAYPEAEPPSSSRFAVKSVLFVGN
jgi:hypothetical protein